MKTIAPHYSWSWEWKRCLSSRHLTPHHPSAVVCVSEIIPSNIEVVYMHINNLLNTQSLSAAIPPSPILSGSAPRSRSTANTHLPTRKWIRYQLTIVICFIEVLIGNYLLILYVLANWWLRVCTPRLLCCCVYMMEMMGRCMAPANQTPHIQNAKRFNFVCGNFVNGGARVSHYTRIEWEPEMDILTQSFDSSFDANVLVIFSLCAKLLWIFSTTNIHITYRYCGWTVQQG